MQTYCGSEDYNTKNLISYFIVVIAPKHSLYQPLLHVGSVFCVFVVVLY